MGTISNPLWNPLTTPSNPTGQNVAVPGAGVSSTGSNPLLPSPGASMSAPTSSNPYGAGFPSSGVAVPGGAPPAFGANAGPYTPTSLTTPVPGQPTTNVGQAAASPIGGMNTMSPTDLSRMFDSLKKTYGDGTAHAILNFLTSGAGFNQDAINNMLAALQPGIERGTESLAEQFSASGNRFGSGAQIGMADYLSQVNLNEGQLETQMYEQAIQNYMNILTGTGTQQANRIANSPSTWDTIQQGLQIAGAGAGAASAAGVGGTAGTLLDIAAAAAV